jgi:Flp pilus assembly pilin Flp
MLFPFDRLRRVLVATANNCAGLGLSQRSKINSIPFAVHFYRNERGATATEYAMLVVFLALAVALGAQTLAGGINDFYTTLKTTITAIPMPSP